MDTLNWVVVPAGRGAETSSGALQANIVIIPQLQAASLAEAGLASWPPRELATGKFWLDFTTVPGAPLAASLPLTLNPVAEPGLWERMFPSTMSIRPSDGSEDTRTFKVAPTTASGLAAEQIFRAAAEAPVDAAGDVRDGLASAVSDALTRHILPTPELSPVAHSAAAPSAPPDFHDILGLLREHPTVQKSLGLILPATVAATAELPADGVVRVRWENPPASIPAITSPWTCYELSPLSFLPKSTNAISSGMVRLVEQTANARDAGTPAWHTFTVDVDAANSSLRTAAAGLSADSAAPKTLPALRTGGVALGRAGLQQDLEARRQRWAKARVANEQAGLTADDLLLGYRLDVKHAGGTWRSLTSRLVSYSIDGVPLAGGKQPEEGHTKHGAAFDYGDGILRTDELVARWTGWSLAVKRPAFSGDPVNSSVSIDPPPHFGFQFDVAPGSLPPLRFGFSYQVRLRVADLAGGGLALSDVLAENFSSQPVLFGRYEPIGSPQVILPDSATIGEGESLIDIVVRSDRDMTPEQFAAANPSYPTPAVRIIMPPRTSLAMAEQHGMFDNMPPEQSWTIVEPVLTGTDPEGALALPDPAAGTVSCYVATTEGGTGLTIQSSWPSWPVIAPKRILVRNRLDPHQPLLTWQDDELSVWLKQAQTATIEVSSGIRDTFEPHMSAYNYLSSQPAAVSAAKNGRHPLLTPAISLRVTHATRKPLCDPRSELSINRQDNETFATLIPDTAIFGVDAASTSKIEISADWTEPDDEKTATVSGRPVKDLAIDPGGGVSSEPVRQEFGDTRHRMVTYSVKAVSRFRHCFRADEPDEFFVAVAKTGSLSIKNTAEPPPPKVTKVYPSFLWTNMGDTTRTRDCMLRVELERPWYATGEGEVLAVIVCADNAPAPDVAESVSQVGRDPLWQSGTTQRWLRGDQLSSRTADGVTIMPPGALGAVIAVPHQVSYDAARECWYSDIAFAQLATLSYAPLVQLCVARYQPESLEGRAISKIVQTSFVPLMPSRKLSWTQADAQNISVTLEGIGQAGPSTNVVEIALEQRPRGTGDWTGPTVIQAESAIPGWRAVPQTTTGTLGAGLALPLPQGEFDRRIRVTEYEYSSPANQVGALAELQRRAVFTDLIELR